MMRIHLDTDLPESLREQITSLLVGDRRSGLLCPVCGGGRTHERSLSASRSDDRIYLKCWRAGCGYLAQIPKWGQQEVMLRPPKIAAVYWGATTPASSNTKKFLEIRYGIWPTTTRVWSTKDATEEKHPAIYMPVYSHNRNERGGVLRILTTPKQVRSYKQTDEPWQAWYKPAAPTTGVVIVEDQLSAMRCWQLNYVSVALLGTNLSRVKMREIKDYYPSGPYYLCLDSDAWIKACAYAQKWPKLRPILLQKDIKDSTDDEIREKLE